MQCNVEGMACIAVYIRVDRRAQCDDVLLTACACARFPSQVPSAFCLCPATSPVSPNRTAACAQKHKHSADRRTLPSIETQSLPRDIPCADTREREAAGLFSLMEAIASAFPIRLPCTHYTYDVG